MNFRVPCRSGICINPMEVTSCQLIANEILPTSIVKTLLYPGAIVNAVLNGVTIPNYDNLLDIYNLTHVKSAPTILDLRHLEVRCYSFCPFKIITNHNILIYFIENLIHIIFIHNLL